MARRHPFLCTTAVPVPGARAAQAPCSCCASSGAVGGSGRLDTPNALTLAPAPTPNSSQCLWWCHFGRCHWCHWWSLCGAKARGGKLRLRKVPRGVIVQPQTNGVTTGPVPGGPIKAAEEDTQLAISSLGALSGRKTQQQEAEEKEAEEKEAAEKEAEEKEAEEKEAAEKEAAEKEAAEKEAAEKAVRERRCHAAASKGDLAALTHLVEWGVDVNATDEASAATAATPIHLSAHPHTALTSPLPHIRPRPGLPHGALAPYVPPHTTRV